MEDPEALSESDRRFLRRYTPIAAFIGGLCCFTPVVVVFLGIGSVSYAASLTDLLYYEYAWAFRLAGLTFLLAAFVGHLSVMGCVASTRPAGDAGGSSIYSLPSSRSVCWPTRFGRTSWSN